MKTGTVTTPDGLTLATYESGTPTGPAILFIHGFSQSALCWRAQLTDPALQGFRLAAYDVRGHGGSDQPADPATYADDARYAADTAAVMRALGLDRPTLVGWSYAGRLINDYLRAHGDTRIAGINYVCARTRTDPAFNGPGCRFLKAMQGDDLTAEIAATRAFLDACFATPPPPDLMAEALAYNMRMRPATRRAQLSRPPDDGAIMAAITCPVLITQGSEDQLVSQGLAHVTAAAIPHARLSLYERIGHSPFIEDAARFNRELAEFVLSCRS